MGLYFVAVTLYEVNQLPLEHQLQLAFLHSTCLASRWEQEGGMNLYPCADEGRGFFVEVGYNESQQCPWC